MDFNWKITLNKIIWMIVFLSLSLYLYSLDIFFLFIFVLILVILEVASYYFANFLRKKFPWFITAKDEFPMISEEGLDKFMPHGFDKELGWIRKPNSKKEELGKYGKTEYSINARGSRKNPRYENLPVKISCYGDSFTFARQVNDNETWEHYLSRFSKSNVLNFGVGNYGLDQSLLRLKREYPLNKSKIVIMGVVPSTIVRILSLWKHYNEFGNTFAFKPMYQLKNNKLVLIKNKIDSKEKFLNLKRYLPFFKRNDYFYKKKFRKEMIRSPYFISIISNPGRNFRLIYWIIRSLLVEKSTTSRNQPYPLPMKVIMDVNLNLRCHLYKYDDYALELMKRLVEEFISYGKEQGFTPVFLFMPQKDDLLYIKKSKDDYYRKFIDCIKDKLLTIDTTENLLKQDNLDQLYSDDTKYGGHYSKTGNEIIARLLFKEFKKNFSLAEL